MPMLTTLRIRAPVWPVHCPPRTRSAKSAIRSSTAMHVRHDVLAVDDDRRPFRRPQRDVQRCAVLGAVDLLAAEHRADARGHARFVGERDEQAQASRR